MTKNSKMNCWRQGDVLILEVEGLPPNLSKIKPDKDRNILAWGEVTGHAHALLTKESEFFEAPNKARYLVVDKEAALKHEEHATITLPRGNYRIIQQVEYQREFKQVVD